MEEYKNYLDMVNKLFANTHESAGGQEFRFYHSVNVANIARQIAIESGASKEDTETAVISAIFHDVAKFLRKQEGGFLDASHKYEEANELERHEKQSADMVKSFLVDDFSEDNISRIQKTISNHSNPETLPEKILHDADELSEMGALNIWKMSTYSAYKKRNIVDTIKYWFETDQQRHIEKMDRLFLDASKVEAQKRINITDSVFENIKNQLSGA